MLVETGTQDSFDRVILRGRWIVLLAVIITLILEHRMDFARPSLICLLLFAGLYNTVIYFWTKKHDVGNRLKILTPAIDLTLVVGLVSLSGGIESPFFDIFYLVIISAGVQMGILGALSVAGVSSVILLAIEVITASGRLSEIDHVLSTIPYLFLVAIASAFLSRQLSRETERRMQAEAQSRELELIRERSHRELEFAQAVQAALLPADIPSIPGLEIAAKSIPAREIGGDLYDFIYRPSGSLTAAIVDVSGKGIPAALALSGLMSSLAGSRRLSIQELMSNLNHYMLEHTPEEMFATMGICTLVPRRGKLYVSSAGHEPVLIVRADTGDAELITADGMPLGVSEDTRYGLKSVDLSFGDIVVMYTDGVTDACRETARMDIDGVIEIVKEHRLEHVQTIIDAIFDKLISECVLFDDATAVVIRLVGEPVAGFGYKIKDWHRKV